MKLLMKDFGFSTTDAAAVMGNAGHESNGFETLQEIEPTVAGSRGGFGWFQWTGPRRKAFEAYCARNKLDIRSREANYAFLFLELKDSEKGAVNKTKLAKTLADKVKAFENAFERSGVKHYGSRVVWATRALNAYGAPQKATEAPTAAPKPAPATPVAPVKESVWVRLARALAAWLKGTPK